MQTTSIEFRPASEDPQLVLPPAPASLFSERAERFAALARGHSLADWLDFLAALSRAQHDALKALPELPLPAPEAREEALRYGMPPLPAATLARPAAWIEVARKIAAALEAETPASARPVLAALRAAPPERLEKMASALLAGVPEPQDTALLPIVGAALQVVWTAMASRLGAGLRPLPDAPGVCPCCGSLPVASIVRLSPTVNKLRYLHCSLCNTEWNQPRATCITCGTDKGVAYHQIEGSNGAVRAETCDSCKSYLKIVSQEKDARVDPVADDLASLALDILVDEAGYARSGPNLLLIGGAGD